GIPVKERVKVSQNWRHGRCRREMVLKWKCKQCFVFFSSPLHSPKLLSVCSLMPWMELDGEYLYLSQAENIQAYRLCPDGTGLQRHPQAIFSGHQEDVCRFVLVNSHIVSGGGDGNIVLHKIRGSYSVKFSAHEQEVNCVDFQGGLIVSGSRDRTAKVWSLSAGRVGQCLHTVQTEDRVWSIAISPLLSSFVTGTACCGHTSPLRIWDLESGQLLTCLGTDFHRGAGVLDVFYETPSLLLSCGYDTYIRYWDIRTSTRKCVQEWEEPHDSALYCIRSDKNHMIASGSSYYGVVRLWDKRQTQCLQSFHLSSPISSPVYCLRFSTTHLYAALASALHVLDFTAL
ncbi:FBXW4 protein, partial [Pluvianellus socialis]|nr:FBXW4 protein [Pluvianellus socialis]